MRGISGLHLGNAKIDARGSYVIDKVRAEMGTTKASTSACSSPTVDRIGPTRAIGHG